MAGEDYQSWSVTAADNANADSAINWAEGQPRASVNNSSRSQMAAHAKNRNLLNGSIVTTGSPNAHAFISGVSYTAMPAMLVVKLKVGASLTNTGSATLNMDGLGDFLIKDDKGKNLLGGELAENSYTDFLWNGTNWVFLYSRSFFFNLVTGGGGLIIQTQVFSSSGSYTFVPDPLMESCVIECIGGGGAGGGTPSGNATTFLMGGGGGSGGYSRTTATAAQIGASQVVTVGTAGLGTPYGDGTSGGASSVGSLCSAGGGYGGGANTVGGPGAPPDTGDVAAGGAPGTGGLYNFATNVANVVAWAANGGSSVFGGGGVGGVANGGLAVNGGDATSYGSGGGGGSTNNSGQGSTGGHGSGGIVIITEYGGRGAPGRDGAPGPQGPIGPTGPAGPGTGNVISSGTPVAGQIAQWVDASHIQGVNASATMFSTGDVKLSLKNVADAGWVLMNDGTIGSASSGGTTRANADCQALFTLLWNNVIDAWCPVSGGRGGSAAADWSANKTIKLPRALGRALAGYGAGAGLANRVLGQYVGEENHALTTAELAAHGHALSDPGHSHTTGSNYCIGFASTTVDPGSTYNVYTYYGFSNTVNGAVTGVTIANTGSGTAHNTMQPTLFLNVMIKL